MAKKFDKEYSTQYMKEVDFLTEKGIKYTYVKRDDDGIRIYKFTKNSELFKTLYEFYGQGI